MTVTHPHHLPRQLVRLARGVPVGPASPADARARADSGAPVRRVRHEVRDGVAVIVFSAAASTGVALVLLLLVRVAG